MLSNVYFSDWGESLWRKYKSLYDPVNDGNEFNNGDGFDRVVFFRYQVRSISLLSSMLL